MADFSLGETYKNTKEDLESKGLIEGEDFYINSEGSVIMTANVDTLTMDPLTIHGTKPFSWAALALAGAALYAATR